MGTRPLFQGFKTRILVYIVAVFGAIPFAQAQQIAGVHVDAEGVLRKQTFRDPNMQQMRQKAQAAMNNLPRELARPSKLRMVSLTRLEQAIQQRLANGQGVTDEMKYLAGLTRIKYVFFFPETKDVVVAGPAEGFALDLAGRPVGIHSGRAVLELQDMIVALRSFGPTGQHADIISVSIDPTQAGLQSMQNFLVRIAGRITPNDDQRIANGLKESLGKQTVSINGVSPKTHFAQVLVEADYRMKLIGIGLERPPAKIVSYVAKANPRDVARNALQRWYFTPNYECVKVSEDGMAMELVGDGVKLIGEDEMVQNGGARIRSGRIDRASQAFVKSFTTNYGDLADRSPVYAQLRNLIDMSIVAAYIQQEDYYGQAEWDLPVFSNEDAYPVHNYVVPKQVESAVNVVWKGRTLMTPIGGGVEIRAANALATDRLIADEGQKLEATRKRMAVAEKAEQWWWD